VGLKEVVALMEGVNDGDSLGDEEGVGVWVVLVGDTSGDAVTEGVGGEAVGVPVPVRVGLSV